MDNVGFVREDLESSGKWSKWHVRNSKNTGFGENKMHFWGGPAQLWSWRLWWLFFSWGCWPVDGEVASQLCITGAGHASGNNWTGYFGSYLVLRISWKAGLKRKTFKKTLESYQDMESLQYQYISAFSLLPVKSSWKLITKFRRQVPMFWKLNNTFIISMSNDIGNEKIFCIKPQLNCCLSKLRGCS